MKYTLYLRVAKTNGKRGYQVAASSKPNNTPLVSNKGYRGETWHPTVAFAVNVGIPDEIFNQATRVIAELNVAMKEAQVSTEIVLPRGITLKNKK